MLGDEHLRGEESQALRGHILSSLRLRWRCPG
jgi:hypothetical protein